MGASGKLIMPLVQKFQRRNLRSGVNDMTLRATCFHKHGVYIYTYIICIYIYSKSFVRYISFVSYDSLVILTGAPSPSTALIWNQTTVRLFTSRLRGNEKTSHVLLWHVMTEVKHGCFDFLFLDINLIHIYIYSYSLFIHVTVTYTSIIWFSSWLGHQSVREVGWSPDVKDPMSFVEPKGESWC